MAFLKTPILYHYIFTIKKLTNITPHSGGPYKNIHQATSFSGLYFETPSTPPRHKQKNLPPLWDNRDTWQIKKYFLVVRREQTTNGKEILGILWLAHLKCLSLPTPCRYEMGDGFFCWLCKQHRTSNRWQWSPKG